MSGLFVAVLIGMFLVAMTYVVMTTEAQMEEKAKDPEYQKQLAERQAQIAKEERDKANGYRTLAANQTMMIIEVTALHGYKQVDYLINNSSEWVLVGSNILGGDYNHIERTCHGMIWTGKVAVPTTYSCDRDEYTELMDRFVFVKKEAENHE